MSGTAAAAVVVLITIALACLGLWIMREGFRQGDESEDATSEVTVGRGVAGEVVVRAELVNRSMSPLVITSSVRWVSRFRPLTGVGRITRQRVHRDLDDPLIAVDGGDTVHGQWSAGTDSQSRRLVVDLYLWQRAGRIRRHRRVFLVEPSVDPTASWQWIGAVR